MRRFGRWRGLAAVSFILGAILSSRSVSASDPFTLKAELGNPLGNLPGDIFGFSVAMSRDGSTDVVSGMQSGSEGGVAYVYLRPWRGWATRPVPSSTLRVPSAAVAAGVAVATNADGSLVAVEPLSGNLSGNNTTVLDVMVYVRPKGGWNGPSSPAAQLHAPLANNSPTFGLSMSGDGGTVVIGRPGDGDALVFVRPAGGWTGHLEATAALVKPPDAATNFGFSTAVSGDGAWIAVGAPSVVNGATGQGGVQGLPASDRRVVGNAHEGCVVAGSRSGLRKGRRRTLGLDRRCRGDRRNQRKRRDLSGRKQSRRHRRDRLL